MKIQATILDANKMIAFCCLYWSASRLAAISLCTSFLLGLAQIYQMQVLRLLELRHNLQHSTDTYSIPSASLVDTQTPPALQSQHHSSMASKKALTDEELFAQFEDIPSSTPDAAAPKPKSGPKASKPAAPPAATEDDDPLAELSALAAAKPVSRPHTPRLSSSTTSGTTGPKVATPSSSGVPSGRNSEDKAGEARNEAAAPRSSMQPSAETVKPSDASPSKAASGGGWWGSVFTAASAAVKQAEHAVKEIRGNEEAMKWAEQMRGNVETLRTYGMYTYPSTSKCPNI